MSIAYVILFTGLIAISMLTGQIHAQSQTPVTEIFVGTTFPRPSIDGQWQSQNREWAASIGYTLPIGVSPSINPSIRLMHDNATLYGLIDVPSDLKKSGTVVLKFYTNASSMIDDLTISFSANQTQLVWVNAPEPAASMIRQHTQAATSLSATIHSQSNHRVWEFSIQLYPFLIGNVLDGISMGLQVIVTDSTGNQASLVGADQVADMLLVANVECIC
jgi:hypothetical protein